MLEHSKFQLHLSESNPRRGIKIKQTPPKKEREKWEIKIKISPQVHQTSVFSQEPDKTFHENRVKTTTFCSRSNQKGQSHWKTKRVAETHHICFNRVKTKDNISNFPCKPDKNTIIASTTPQTHNKESKKLTTKYTETYAEKEKGKEPCLSGT